ncbi:MAG TPA: hypothetical protein VFL14_06355 [Xanthomonadales bacterium]|nr:hypothetical protein [Xanthomonadales bacterium]
MTMTFGHFCAIMAAYAFVYYASARYVVRALAQVDPPYHAGLGARPGASGRNSLAIMRVLFDADLPKAGYPARVGRALYLARAMLAFFPFAVVLLFVLRYLYFR